MIAISDDFKNAIKNNNREIKGYTEVLYSQENIIGYLLNDGIIGDSADIVIQPVENDLLYGNRVVTNYASLEENYFKLDGSFILPNNPNIYDNINTGYISNELENEYNEKKITINIGLNQSASNMTIYFKDNIPSVITVKIYYSDGGEIKSITKIINDNLNDVVYFEFDKVSNIAHVDISFDNFNYANRRIRIPKIEFGITNIYRDNDLIDFKIIEQISEFNTDTPIDECDLTINNYDNKFDIMNPNGMTKYLNENVQVIPYIGIVTEHNGVEYVPMGIYYLQNYTNNSDKTTTFHCEKNFRKLASSNSYFRVRNTPYYNTTASNFFEGICQAFKIENYSFNATTENDVVNDDNIPIVNKLQHLNEFAVFSNIIIKNGRNDDIVSENIGSNIEDTLSLNEMKTIPEYAIKTPLKSITINKTDLVLGNFKEDYDEIFEGDITVKEDNPFIIILNQPKPVVLTFNPSVSVSEYYTYEIQNGGYFISTGKLVGDYHLYIRTLVDYNEQSTPIKFNYEEDGLEVEINNGFYNKAIENASLSLNTAIQNTADFIKNNYKKYNVKIDYFGNPAYETNDVLKIETPYGYKTMRILKHSLTFNGGLSGSIEGVGD